MEIYFWNLHKLHCTISLVFEVFKILKFSNTIQDSKRKEISPQEDKNVISTRRRKLSIFRLTTPSEFCTVELIN